jgi:hypothetical protein
MKCHKGERRAREQVKECGLELVDIRYSGGGHFKAIVRAPDGRQECHVFASTPGDNQRSHKNKVAELRRFARGISTKQERPSP